MSIGEPPAITAVLICKNAIRDVADAVESVLRQDYSNVRCVVVDLGSTDGTVELVRRYGASVTLMLRPDMSTFDALNEAFKQAETPFLAWLSESDRWLEGTVSTATRVLSDDPEVEVLYGCYGVLGAEGSLERIEPALDWDLQTYLVGAKNFIRHSTVFLKRKTFERLNAFRTDESFEEDFWLRAGLQHVRYRALPLLMAYSSGTADKPRDSSSRITPRIELTKRILSDPTLPASLRKESSLAMSNTYLECLHFLQVRRPYDWLRALYLLVVAVKSHPANTRQATKKLWGNIAWRVSDVLLPTARALKWRLRRLAHPVAAALSFALILAAVAGSAVAALSGDEGGIVSNRTAGQVLLAFGLLAVWLEVRRR
jgi:glycosyltransferase involved in cell wall biosynthesis